MERPGSGSELASRFDRSIGYFWQATHQQIYRELARLEKAGFIEGLAAETGRGRKRKYQVLPAGREELERWTGTALAPIPMRDEMLVRVRAAAALAPATPELLEELERLAAHHREKLAVYRKIEARDFPSGPQSQAHKLRHLVLKGGIDFEQGRAAFLEEALAILRAP
jgi:DNA-binding PadR family transcriptional regulator